MTGAEERRAVKSARVVALLRRELPRMQPSALKHEYLSSVANVYNHPVAGIKHRDGTEDLIGWADWNRTLPLHLVVDADRTVRHAFVPHPDHDRRLLEPLQQDEDRWCREHGTTPRNVSRQIRDFSREEVNLHGLNRYDPPPTLSHGQRLAEQHAVQTWYITRPIKEGLTVDHDGPPKLELYDDTSRLAANLVDSVNMNAGPDDPHVAKVDFGLSRAGTPEFRGLTTEPRPKRRPDPGIAQYLPDPDDAPDDGHDAELD